MNTRCKRCGDSNVFWYKTKKGKNCLMTHAEWRGEHGGYKVIQVPHRCNGDGSWQEEERKQLQAQLDAGEIIKGQHVVVWKGRKVPKGIEGTVFWTGPDRYTGITRVGFKTESGETYYTDASNVTATKIVEQRTEYV